MIRACSRSRLRNPAIGSGSVFNPLSLFTAGEQGIWFDPGDLTTLFQDDAGTVPVTTDGQAVALMRDKSGNAHHAAQTVAGSRPIFRTSAGLSWLEFDGVDDFLLTNTVNLTATDEIGVFVGALKLSDATTSLIVESGPLADSNPSFSLFGPSSAGANKFDFRIRGTTTVIASTTNTAFNAPITAVVTGQGDLSTPPTTLRVNGVQAASTVAAPGGGTFGNQPIYIGRRAGISFPFTGNIYSVIIRGAASDALTVARTEGYTAAKSGVTLP